MIFDFINPAIHGLGYIVLTTGLATVAGGLVLAIYRMITDRPKATPHRTASTHRETDPARRNQRGERVPEQV
jgi:hypothetical protein